MPEEKNTSAQSTAKETPLDISALLPIIIPQAVQQIEETKSLIELNARATIAAKMIGIRQAGDKVQILFDEEEFERVWAIISNGYPVTDFSEPMEPEAVNGAIVHEE